MSERVSSTRVDAPTARHEAEGTVATCLEDPEVIAAIEAALEAVAPNASTVTRTQNKKGSPRTSLKRNDTRELVAMATKEEDSALAEAEVAQATTEDSVVVTATEETMVPEIGTTLTTPVAPECSEPEEVTDCLPSRPRRWSFPRWNERS